MISNLSVPIRRSRWPSLVIGAIALALSAILAAALAAFLVLSKAGGTMVVLVFGITWGVMFFGSFRWQRRCARHCDLRRPGIRLAGTMLEVPTTEGLPRQFDLGKPHELRFGWSEFTVATIAAPTMHTRTVLICATFSQDGRQVFLKAEDSVREAKSAGWPQVKGLTLPSGGVRVWAKDLVVLVEAMRALSHKP